MQHKAAARARLAALDCELARLAAQHDVAMSAFRFDEAGALQRRIVVLERERAAAAAAVPAAATPAEPPTGIVPRIASLPRRARRR